MSLLLAFSAWAQESKPFKAEELDQMRAPIALYPDAMLSQVLMASNEEAAVKLDENANG